MTARIRRKLSDIKSELSLPARARQERRRDLKAGLYPDPGIHRSSKAAVQWLLRAQQCSTTNDGGVARHFSLTNGWGPSYPETTGYIVPTLIDYGKQYSDQSALHGARSMLDWLVRIQMPCGGFQGGVIGSEPKVPVTFNTGQILIGLARGAGHFGEPYKEPMHQAARWLVDTQDADGCWRKHPTPFAEPGEKTYETHVAWGLFEAARVARSTTYADAAVKNVRWALKNQHDNGWFDDCCLSDPDQPLTHTIGYALRGILEAYRFTQAGEFLTAAERTGRAMLDLIESDGYLAGTWTKDWRPAANWACLTGTVQIAYCWLMLYEFTKQPAYRGAAFAAIEFVRRTVQIDGPEDIRGAVKGSFPVSGQYGQYSYLNWAAKFLIDANQFEDSIRHRDCPPVHA